MTGGGVDENGNFQPEDGEAAEKAGLELHRRMVYQLSVRKGISTSRAEIEAKTRRELEEEIERLEGLADSEEQKLF